MRTHTRYNHSSTYRPSRSSHCGEVHIHRINNVFEIERHLYIKHLSGVSKESRIMPFHATFEPTNKAKAVVTLILVPSSPYQSIIYTAKERHQIGDDATFGHRYRTISFMIAQSALLCSLLDTVCSASSESVFGSASFASAGLCTASGLTFSKLSVFEGDWSCNNRGEGSNRRLRGIPQCKGRARHILDNVNAVFWCSSFHA